MILSRLFKTGCMRSSPPVEWELIGNQMAQSDNSTGNLWLQEPHLFFTLRYELN